MSKYCCLIVIAVAGCSGASDSPPLPTGNFAVVTTSGGIGQGGAVNTVRLSDKMVVKGLDTTIDQDNTVRIADGKAYVLNRGPGTLRVYDINTWKQPIEIPTGDATADHAMALPEDVLPVGGNRVYVTMGLNDAAHALGIIDITDTSGVEKWIELPPQSGDHDGKSEPFDMYACDGKAYVLMGDYDEMTYDFVGKSRIAVIDVASDTLEGFITLSAQSPTSIAPISADCHDVVVSQSGPFGKLPDGTAGIEHVDLAQKKSLGMLITDAAMQGRPNTLSVANHHLAFASIYFDPEPEPTTGMDILSSTKVIAFDPVSGKILGDVTGKAPFITFATVTPDGEIAVGVDAYPGSISDGKLASGLYLGAADGSMMSSTPIDLGQNPYAIAFQ